MKSDYWDDILANRQTEHSDPFMNECLESMESLSRQFNVSDRKKQQKEIPSSKIPASSFSFDDVFGFRIAGFEL